MPGSIKPLQRYAVKVYYDGRAYYGFQPQKDKPTVGEAILKALEASGLIVDRGEALFQAASRTDRGVSALGQTIAFNSRERFEVGRLNAYLPEDVWAWAWTPVPLNFNPRREALRRRYLYVAPYGGEDLKAMIRAASIISSTITPPVEVKATLAGEVIRFYFTSKRFTKGLIRKMVTAMLKVGKGELRLEEFRERVEEAGFERLPLPLAPPEPLILLEVEYTFPFQVNSQAVKRLMEKLQRQVCRLETLKACLKFLGEISG